MVFKLQNLGAFGLALFLALSAGLAYFFKIPNGILYAVAFLLSAFFLVFGGSTSKVKRIDAYLAGALLFVLIFSIAPFREFDPFGIGVIVAFFVYFILIQPDSVLYKTVDFLALFCAVSAVSAFFVLLFTFLGADLPHIILSQDFRNNPNDYYKLYPGSLMLSTQGWGEGTGRVVRTSGFLREPGHFAILCAMVLVANRLEITRLRYKLVLMGGILSLSPAFYLIYFTSYILMKFSLRKILYLFIVLLVLAFIGFRILPEDLQYRLLLGYFQAFSEGGINQAIESRGRGEFSLFYSSLDYYTLLLGLGARAPEAFGFFDAHSSDYRSFIVRSGYIALLFWIGLVIVLAFRTRQIGMGMTIIATFLLILFHRSNFALDPVVLVLLFIASRPANRSPVEPRRVE